MLHGLRATSQHGMLHWDAAASTSIFLVWRGTAFMYTLCAHDGRHAMNQYNHMNTCFLCVGERVQACTMYTEWQL